MEDGQQIHVDQNSLLAGTEHAEDSHHNGIWQWWDLNLRLLSDWSLYAAP